MPSLLQGSAQLVRITQVKKDPADHTVAMSILICVAFNADKLLSMVPIV
jgi:hypothetical protein